MIGHQYALEKKKAIAGYNLKRVACVWLWILRFGSEAGLSRCQ
jgi:hypothetical protein